MQSYHEFRNITMEAILEVTAIGTVVEALGEIHMINCTLQDR